MPIDTRYLIANVNFSGPMFGNGFDLAIYDQCNVSNNSFTCAGISYNTIDYKYKNDQASWTALSGSSNGRNFRVVEYEVFRVIR